MVKEILLFGCPQKEDVKQMERAFALLSVQVREIKKQEYLLPLRQLVSEENRGPTVMGRQEDIFSGIPGGGVAGKKVSDIRLSAPVMVFVGFSEAELDNALGVIRQKLGKNKYLKAVLTDYNQNWNILMLLSQLQEEHRKFSS